MAEGLYLAPYRAARVQTRWGLKIDAADAFVKIALVRAEIEAMGASAEVAEFAANSFVWSGGHIACENLLQMQANGALSRWQASKAQARAA